MSPTATNHLVRALFLNGLNKSMKTAVRARDRTAKARRDLVPGSTRAKVTTANARWQTACEGVAELEQARRRFEQLMEMT